MSNINEFCKKLLSYAKTNCDGDFEVYAATGETLVSCSSPWNIRNGASSASM